MDLTRLNAEQLIEALKNSSYQPKHKIIESSFVREDDEHENVYIYHVEWDNVDDYTDVLISCDTLYITELGDILYADI